MKFKVGRLSHLQRRRGAGSPNGQRREMLIVACDMLLILAAMIAWFVISAVIAEAVA